MRQIRMYGQPSNQKWIICNRRSPECKRIVEELTYCFKTLRERMSVKLHFLRSHLDHLPVNRRLLWGTTGNIPPWLFVLWEKSITDVVTLRSCQRYCGCQKRHFPGKNKHAHKKQCWNLLYHTDVYSSEFSMLIKENFPMLSHH